MNKKISILAANSTHMGEDKTRRFVAAGIFYACSISIFGSVPPCDALMRSLPMWWNSTGKAEPFSISAYHNLNNSVMNSTEEKKVERVKNALFTSYQNLAKIHGEDRTPKILRDSIYKINFNLLQLLCSNNDTQSLSIEMANNLFDLDLIYEFIESVEESLKS